MPFALIFSVSMVLSASLFGAGCSNLASSGHACRRDDDCKGDRICGPEAVCSDREQPRPDASPSTQDDSDAGTQDSMAGNARDTVPPCVPEAGCYELVIDSEICPGLEWQMSDTFWACDAMTFTHGGRPYVGRWLHFFSATWARAKPDVAWGPTLTFAEQELVEVSLSHRFDRYGVGLEAVVKLVADGADPHESGVTLWKARGGAQREGVSEKAQVKRSDLPEDLRAQARIVLLAGGTEARTTVAPMSWELIHLRVQAK